jgi:hypothetical protein
VSVSENQLAFDLHALARLIQRLETHRYVAPGAPRLLETLVRRGLDERSLLSPAALVLELDRPNDDRAEGGA